MRSSPAGARSPDGPAPGPARTRPAEVADRVLGPGALPAQRAQHRLIVGDVVPGERRRLVEHVMRGWHRRFPFPGRLLKLKHARAAVHDLPLVDRGKGVLRLGAGRGRWGGLAAYLIRRSATSLVILIGISIFIFILLHSVYPSPAIIVLGPRASPGRHQRVEPASHCAPARVTCRLPFRE